MSRFTKIKFLFACGLLLTLTTDSRADKIVLKDGRVIKCDSARQEGKVVRYFIGESSLTVSMDRVERIESDNEKGDELGAKSSSPIGNNPTNGESAATRLASLPKPNLPTTPITTGARLNSDALAKLEANVKAEPGNAEQRATLVSALKYAAFIEFQGGQFAEAKNMFKRALSWDEKDLDSLNALSTIAMVEGRYSEAVEYSTRAVAVDAKNQYAQFQLGSAYYALEKLPDAIKAWRAALKVRDEPRIRAALEKAEREMEVAGDFSNGRTRFFNISMEGGSPNPGLEIALVNLLDESFGQLKRRFNYSPTEKISAIFYTRDTFSNITQAPTWAGALNDGKLRVPIGGLTGVNDELAKTITHEITHSFVYFKARGKCPTWLNEGLAQTMEGKTTERYRSRLAKLAQDGNLPTLQILSGSFIGFSTAQAEVAYAYSLLATEVLSERGIASAINVLEDLGQNYNISVALSRHTRYQNLEAFEQELKRRLTE